MFFTYTQILISNLHTARKPNELARATNEPSRAKLFTRFC
jgi:hypothetical protein